MLEGLETRAVPASISTIGVLTPSGSTAIRMAAQGQVETAVTKVTPFSSTRVLVEFNQELALGVKASQFSIQGITVSNAQLSVSRKNVVLTTTAQTDRFYTVKVNGLLADDGSLAVADRNLSSFRGVPSGLTPPAIPGVNTSKTATPTSLTAATSLNYGSMLLEFDQKLPANGVSPTNFVIPGLKVWKAQLSSSQKVVLLQTSAQSYRYYHISFNNLNALDGTPVKAPYVAGSVVGKPMPIADTTPPRITSVESKGNTKILVTFSEPMAWQATSKFFYSIVQTVGTQTAGPLAVLSASFVNGDRSKVLLTTSSQNEGSFAFRLSGAKDMAGNSLVADTAQTTLTGTPPSGAEIVDTDADGLPDHLEIRGWDVTVKQADGGSTTRFVFSDRLSPDTDRDGLKDGDEFSAAADPRNGDTDADGLSDFVEVKQIGSSPTKQDTDGDTLTDGREVNVLKTSPLLKDTDGDKVDDATEVNQGMNPLVANPTPPPPDSTPPRVVGAGSTSSTTVIVSFSEPMNDETLNIANYSIRQTNVNPEAGLLIVTAAKFADAEHTAVELTTLSQNDLAYTLRVIGARDVAGNALPAPEVFLGGVVDPSIATFTGKAGTQIVDTDQDGLADNVEQRGWIITFKKADGSFVSRGVTSDPLTADSDNDGLDDKQELSLTTDPRSADTDVDGLTDYQEFNEVYSDPLNQDSDADGLADALEFDFYRTSPVQADTDGDQLPDGEEVLLANRNARVADLPTPAIEIGNMNLSLDVQFSQTTSTGTSTVENKTVSSSLQQDSKKELSNANANTQEAMVKLAGEYSFENSVDYGTKNIGGGVKNSFKVSAETGWTGSWTSSFTSTSTEETQRNYSESLSTNAEVNQNATLVREVKGARMSVTLFLKNASSLAFNIKDLQVTAFLQDPQNPGSLTPLATLLPDNAPADGFTLGPLVPERGPFIFSSETIFASTVEALMKNPTGVVFKIANFDITDELGRNFAFSSRDIFDRTNSLVIDYGGFDSDNDGEGDLTENLRVATDGGRVIDTNGDGKVDGDDHRVIFDANGKQVGLSLRDALEAAGLSHYDEKANPTATLSDAELRTSYSTEIGDDGVERIARVRTVGARPGVRKAWVVLTPTGINPDLGLDNTILTPTSDVKLAFVQDLDGDLVPASVEAVFGTSDEAKDTDADGLDDRFETLVGWNVDLGGQGTIRVFSRGNVADSDQDGLSDFAEAPSVLTKDARGLITRADPGAAYVQNGVYDIVTDPTATDTDRDGVRDGEEVNGYSIKLRNGSTITVTTNPMRRDTDGDTASDGTERRLGGNPTDASDRDSFADDDSDGLINIEETTGYNIVIRGVSTSPLVNGTATTILVKSNPNSADSDGDGVSDFDERQALTNPSNSDTDSDGISDRLELLGFTLRNQGVIQTNAVDADTDNDMRSDGAEAELVDIEANRWIVRPDGRTPYRAYSDPLQADADFDGLVDGQEYSWVASDGSSYRSDPSLANTDGDSRGDLEEFQVGLNPLVEDFLVTVIYQSLKLTNDGDAGTNSGDFFIGFGASRLGASPTGPGQNVLSIDNNSINLPTISDPAQNSSQTLVKGQFSQILLNEASTLDLAQLGVARSSSFSVAKDQMFSISGQVREIDGNAFNYINFGGLEGVQAVTDENATVRGIFAGSSLTAGMVRQLTFTFTAADNVFGASPLGGVSDGIAITGSVKVLFVVS